MKKIMVVDGERLILGTLTREGYSVVTAEDGQQALELLRE